MDDGLYMIHEARFGGAPVRRAFVITLHVEGGQVRGATLRSEHVFEEGQAGALGVMAARDGVVWRMRFPRVRVRPVTAVEAEIELVEAGEFERAGTVSGKRSSE